MVSPRHWYHNAGARSADEMSFLKPVERASRRSKHAPSVKRNKRSVGVQDGQPELKSGGAIEASVELDFVTRRRSEIDWMI